jgi:hypothetical protein
MLYPRRGAGVDYQARLESVCSRQATVGSNPTLSALSLSDVEGHPTLKLRMASFIP